MTALLEIRDLSVSVAEGHLWNRKAKQLLHAIHFQINEGESVAYLGPNGAGKTTTFRALCGLTSTFKGSFLWKGQAILNEQLHQHIGFLPEIPYFYRNLTPRELLTGLGRLSDTDNQQLKRTVSHWSERLDFEIILDRPIRTCSKGQLQRIGLTQALMQKPDLLILDEPMSGLDPIGREIVRSTLTEVNNNGTALLFSSHILSDAESLCHKVVALNQGRVIYNGSLDGLVSEKDHWSIHLRSETAIQAPDNTKLTSLTDESLLITGNGGHRSLQQSLQSLTSSQNIELIHAGLVKPKLEDAFVELINKSAKGDHTYV
ncbi:MAG: ABC transporter ATP-binding protein [Mariprofundaceae bacterium]